MTDNCSVSLAVTTKLFIFGSFDNHTPRILSDSPIQIPECGNICEHEVVFMELKPDYG